MDKQSIFRRESLDRVESPEQLDAYIKGVSSEGLVNYGGTSGSGNICDCMERCRKSSADDDSERSYCWR